MNTTCNAGPANYIPDDTFGSATILGTSFVCNSTLNLPALNIGVERRLLFDVYGTPMNYYEVSLTATSSPGTTGPQGPVNYLYFIYYGTTGVTGSMTANGSMLENSFGAYFPLGDNGYVGQTSDANAETTGIMLTTTNIPSEVLHPSYYRQGDIYTIDISTGGSSTMSGTLTANLTRGSSPPVNLGGPGFMGGTGPCSTCSCLPLNSCGSIQVPEAFMTARTTITGSDIGEVIFTICDTYSYYKEEKLCSNCGIYYAQPSEIKTTTFDKCCPFIVSVLRGKGNTAYERITYIWKQRQSQIGLTFDEFYTNIVYFSMAKYILARILYGTFNINYLLGKYNEKFLRDLASSRFCNFITFFESCDSSVYGYNQYFRSGDKK